MRRGGKSNSHFGRYNNRNGGGRGGGGYNNNNNRNNRSPGGNKGPELCRFAINGRCNRAAGECRNLHIIHKLGNPRSSGSSAGHVDGASIKDGAMWTAQQQLLTASNDGTIQVWNCHDWSHVSSLTVSTAEPPSSSSSSSYRGGGGKSSRYYPKSQGVTSVLLHGNWLFAGCEDLLGPVEKDRNALYVGRVRAWNLENPQGPPFECCVSTTFLASHGRAVTALAIATDATGAPTLFSGSLDGTLRYWQFVDNAFKCAGTLEGHFRGITCIKTIVIGSASMLITAAMDGVIKIYDLASMTCVHVIDSKSNGHRDAVTALEIWVNGADHFLISAGMDKRVCVWSLAGPNFGQVFDEVQEDAVTSLCGSVDNAGVAILLIGTAEGSIIVKELPSFDYKFILSGRENVGHRDAVRRVFNGPSGVFFSVGDDGFIFAWQFTDSVSKIKST